MHILHVAETITGGVATSLRQLLVAQAEHPDVSRAQALVPAEQQQEISSVCCQAPVVFLRSGRNLSSLLRLGRALFTYVRKEKPDVVHFHSTFAGLIGRPLLLLLRPFWRPQVVYCSHGWAFKMRVPAWQQRLYAGIERLLYPMTDAVICVSQHEYDTARRVGLPAAKMHIILNGVAVPPKIPAIQRQAEAPLQLLFVGRFDWPKAFDIVLEAMQQLEDFPCYLTAVGAPVLAQEQPPQRPNITYTGWLRSEEIQPLMRQADVLVMPSRWEAFGLVAAEAMSQGLPVIASNICAFPELIIHGETGFLVETDDAAAIADIIRLTPRAKWQKLGIAAHKRMAENFSVVQMTSQTLALYKSIVHG